MDKAVAYQEAKKRVEAKVAVYTHFAIYVLVILLLAFVNLFTSRQTMWFHWPMFGWGTGVLIHAIIVFVFPNRSLIIEKMIEKEMKK